MVSALLGNPRSRRYDGSMPGKTNGTSPNASQGANGRRPSPEELMDEHIARYEAEHGAIPQAFLDEFDAHCKK